MGSQHVYGYFSFSALVLFLMCIETRVGFSLLDQQKVKIEIEAMNWDDFII